MFVFVITPGFIMCVSELVSRLMEDEDRLCTHGKHMNSIASRKYAPSNSNIPPNATLV